MGWFLGVALVVVAITLMFHDGSKTSEYIADLERTNNMLRDMIEAERKENRALELDLESAQAGYEAAIAEADKWRNWAIDGEK